MKGLIFLIVITIAVISSTLIEPTYNFGNKQNHEIDLLYNHLLGQNVYSITSDQNGHTQYSTTLYPDLSLQMQFKMYTNNSLITKALTDNQIIFVGIDMNVTNTDIHIPFNDYRTDIIGCELTMAGASCYDYVYQISTSRYIRNTNGSICKNNLLPLGFDSVQVNILKENVLNFDHYYSVFFNKVYPPNFDNITMFNWINYVAADMDHYVNSFYGVGSVSSDFDSFTSISMLFYKNAIYEDGSGLLASSSPLAPTRWLFVIVLISVLLG